MALDYKVVKNGEKYCVEEKATGHTIKKFSNQEEAKTGNVFIAGWRPFIGWICGLGLLYVSLVEPIGRFIATVFFHYAGAFPVINTDITMQVMMGMLGLAAARTVEKVKGAEGNR